MTDALWDRTWSVFHAALEVEPDRREAFIDSECKGDEALRREVRELLAGHDRSGMLDASPVRALAEMGETGSLEGKQVGRYLVRSRIGYGGMGVVYDAEQESPVRRRVALKVIHPGTHPEAASRFALERQALALMTHPNIARVFDAGLLDDGRPFIAMEHVAGAPLNEYCDVRRLTVTQRLELFLLICEAIQHAHQKGIIHRDIKPSNVLVSDDGSGATPKVIDFGVAKTMHPILDSEGHLTLHGSLIGTLEYMSPEQLNPAGIDTDTRSDIYSLGVMLYEMLTGVLPFDWAAVREGGLEGLRKVSLTEPPRPSRRVRELTASVAATVSAHRQTTTAALARRLEGDLDWILLKALDRNRARRYVTASEFADDLRRHLRNEPVLAAAPSATYRLSKFVRRHRGAVSATAAVAAGLAGFAAVLTLQSLEIRRSAERAERQRARAERVSQFLVDVFQAADPFQGRGSEVKAREVLDRSFARMERELNNDPEVKASVLTALGSVYGQLRDYEVAERLLRESVTMRRKLHQGDHLETAASLEALGRMLLQKAKYAEAGRVLEETVAMHSRLLAPGDPRRAHALFLLGAVRRSEGTFDQAEMRLREALRLSRSGALDPQGRSLAASTLEELGNLAARKGDFREAESYFREALTIRRRTSPDEPRTADTMGRMGLILVERGDNAAAESFLREALALFERHLGPHHEKLAPSLTNLALCLHYQGKYDEAESKYKRSLAIWRTLHGEAHPGVVTNLNNLGLLEHDRGRYREAEVLYRQALALHQKRLRSGHPDLAYQISNIARLYHDQGRAAEAEPLYRQALELRRKGLKPGHPALADTLVWLGKLLTEKKSFAEAESLLREAVAIRTASLQPDDWRTAEARSMLGGLLVAQGRYTEAEPLLVESYSIMAQKRGTAYRRTQQAHERLMALYEATNRG